MDWIVYALDYLLGAPILGLGTMVGFVWKALLLLVTLLVFTAYVLLADRKIWAAVQIRRGPNVVGAFPISSNSFSRSRSFRPAPTRRSSFSRRS